MNKLFSKKASTITMKKKQTPIKVKKCPHVAALCQPKKIAGKS